MRTYAGCVKLQPLNFAFFSSTVQATHLLLRTVDKNALLCFFHVKEINAIRLTMRDADGLVHKK